MNARQKLSNKVTDLEISLRLNDHIHNPTRFLDKLGAISPYSSFLKDEDRTLFQCAIAAFEAQIQWKSEEDD